MGRLSSLFAKFRRPATRGGEEPSTTDAGEGWMVVGLGNPGRKYSRSRHNLGFMVVDKLAARLGLKLLSRKFEAVHASARIERRQVLLLKARTYYNRTGESVASSLSYFRVSPQRLIVVHDELDLEEGQLRLKRGGGDAGNLGIRSLISALGTADFIRVRIGIGHPPEGVDEVTYLLEPLTTEQLTQPREVIERAAQAVLAVIEQGLERAMGIFNQRRRVSASGRRA